MNCLPVSENLADSKTFSASCAFLQLAQDIHQLVGAHVRAFQF